LQVDIAAKKSRGVGLINGTGQARCTKVGIKEGVGGYFSGIVDGKKV